MSRLLGHAKVSTTDTYLKASQFVADREVRDFHRKHGKLYPGFTPAAKASLRLQVNAACGKRRSGPIR